MEAVALLGGSFDPPHVAHQMLCLWALSTRGGSVWLVPTFSHALGKRLTSFEHRVRMCELALEPFSRERVDVCGIEAELGGPNRTLFTVQALRSRYPGATFSLLVGGDILAQKDEWYRFDELEQMVEIVAVGRVGHGTVSGNITLPEVSSSRIRQALAAGENVSHELPLGVYQYIQEQGLYRVLQGA